MASSKKAQMMRAKFKRANVVEIKGVQGSDDDSDDNNNNTEATKNVQLDESSDL